MIEPVVRWSLLYLNLERRERPRSSALSAGTGRYVVFNSSDKEETTSLVPDRITGFLTQKKFWLLGFLGCVMMECHDVNQL